MNNMQMQQSPFEFLKWIPVSGEKYLGIAVIRFERRFIFRFKILPSEQGGYWVTTASLKTGVFNGKDKYDNAFDMDSTYEKEAMHQFVIEQVEGYLNRQVAPSASVFQSQGQAQQYPNYQQPTQQAAQPSLFTPQAQATSPAYQQQSFDQTDSQCPF